MLTRETVPLSWENVQVRQLSEKVQEQPEYQSDKDKKAEFSIPSWMVHKTHCKYDYIILFYIIILFLRPARAYHG